MTCNFQGDLTFTEVSIQEVSTLLKDLKPSKSCGIDGLTARLIRDCGDFITPVLADIFNLSLKSSIFPDTWKTSMVTALFKEGKRNKA